MSPVSMCHLKVLDKMMKQDFVESSTKEAVDKGGKRVRGRSGCDEIHNLLLGQ